MLSICIIFGLFKKMGNFHFNLTEFEVVFGKFSIYFDFVNIGSSEY